MLILLICLLITSSAFVIFSISIKIDTINRIIITTPKTIGELSIPSFLSEDEKPYFDEVKLNEILTSYYDNCLTSHVKSYKLEYYFYSLTNHDFCYNKCDGVEITFSTKVAGIYDYKKVIFFEIQKGYAYGL